jgi:hypothetical protein
MAKSRYTQNPRVQGSISETAILRKLRTEKEPANPKGLVKQAGGFNDKGVDTLAVNSKSQDLDRHIFPKFGRKDPTNESFRRVLRGRRYGLIVVEVCSPRIPVGDRGAKYGSASVLQPHVDVGGR